MNRGKVRRLVERVAVADPSEDLATRIKAEIPEELGMPPGGTQDNRDSRSSGTRWRLAVAASLLAAIAAAAGWHLLHDDGSERVVELSRVPPAAEATGPPESLSAELKPAVDEPVALDLSDETAPSVDDGEIRALITDEHGRAVPDVKVMLYSEGPPGGRRVHRSDSDGNVQFSHLDGGQYRLETNRPGYIEPEAAAIRIDHDSRIADLGIVLNTAFDEEIAVFEEFLVVDHTMTSTGVSYSVSTSNAYLVDGVDTTDVGLPSRGQMNDTWRRSRLTPNTSRLTVGDDDELPLERIQTHVQIDGFRARVVLDLLYRNDRMRQLEGKLQVRLPESASPFYLAFGEEVFHTEGLPSLAPLSDVTDSDALEPELITRDRHEHWSNVKQARMVPRAQGALAYIETVRRRVDPALMEWAGAGVFNARVFPLMPGKLHRIVIGYDVDLVEVGNDLEYRLDLPEVEADTSVDLSVLALGDTAVTIEPHAEGRSVKGRHVFHFENPESSTVRVRLRSPGPTLLVGSDDRVGRLFAIRVRPELPTHHARHEQRNAVFAVDVSLSSSPDRFNIWLDLMEAILNQNRGSLDQFAVMFFNVETFWWRPDFVNNTAENVTQLMAFARELALEGATDLGAALAEATAPRQLGPGATSLLGGWHVFLLSDGSPTWGKDLAASCRDVDHRVFAYATGLAGTDIGTLARIARNTGGAVFTVSGDSEVDRAAVAHRLQPWAVHSAEVVGSSDVMIAGRVRSVFPGQTLTLVGRGAPAMGEAVELRFASEYGGRRRTVRIVPQHVVESNLANRTYGQVATAHLEGRGQPAEEATQAFASHFRITGRTCSLLMMETERDYQRFGLEEKDDAAFVEANPVAAVVAAIPDRDQADVALDPAERFLSWLARIEHYWGLDVEAFGFLRAAVRQLPPSSFEVESNPLRAKVRRKKRLPTAYLSVLTEAELDTETVHAECGRRLIQKSAADAVKAVSSLVEARPGDFAVLHDVAAVTAGWGFGTHAYHLLRRVAEARPYNPYVYYAMARALADAGHADLAMLYFEVALGADWDEDEPVAVAASYLSLLRRIESGALTTHLPALARERRVFIEEQLDLAPADLVVIVTWTTDRTDVDLHVFEPTGEKCYYGHAKTKIGGEYFEDFIEGFGPEMYILRDAPPGQYRIVIDYYADEVVRTSTPTRVYATVFENWGRENETTTTAAVTLTNDEESLEVLSVTQRGNE